MNDPTSPAARMADLMRQGFMKPRRQAKARPLPGPHIACDDCLNWHPARKHTADAATRKANRAARATVGKTTQHTRGTP